MHNSLKRFIGLFVIAYSLPLSVFKIHEFSIWAGALGHSPFMRSLKPYWLSVCTDVVSFIVPLFILVGGLLILKSRWAIHHVLCVILGCLIIDCGAGLCKSIIIWNGFSQSSMVACLVLLIKDLSLIFPSTVAIAFSRLHAHASGEIHNISCPKCDYSLNGLSLPRCPECGVVTTIGRNE